MIIPRHDIDRRFMGVFVQLSYVVMLLSRAPRSTRRESKWILTFGYVFPGKSNDRRLQHHRISRIASYLLLVNFSSLNLAGLA